MINKLFNKSYFLKFIEDKLTIGLTKQSGINMFGRKTVYTKGFTILKKRYYLIDFFRNKIDIVILLKIFKYKFRTSFLGLVCLNNGLFTYIILSDKVQIGDIFTYFSNIIKYGVSSFLLNVESGNIVHHIEFTSGKGAKLCLAAGTSAFIISKEDNFCYLKMKSGWLLKISNFSGVVLGCVSNVNHNIEKFYKAGQNRLLGFKSKVRGVAMNPCDHPHGGGEGKSPAKAAPRTPWGKLARVPTKRYRKFLEKKKKYKKY